MEREIPKNRVVKVDAEHAYGVLAQEDERGGGAVIIMNLKEPIDLKPVSRWYPTNLAHCQEARKQGAIVDQEKPFWWEAPVNVALGRIDTMEIVNNHMMREGIWDYEAWGRPRERDRHEGKEGFIFYVLDLYYHYLNLGLRIAISAGSASGVLKNPIGYNRLYVHLKDGFSYEKWFKGMKDGRAFATNGPMLFFSIDGCELFSTLKTGGEPFQGRARLSVLSQSPLDRAEIIFNGEVIRRFQARNSQKRLEEEFELTLNESGWIAARAFEKQEKTIRFAHTNPIFIEVGCPMKPKTESARFYAEWCRQLLFQSMKDLQRYETENQRREVEETYKKAIEFYEQFLNK